MKIVHGLLASSLLLAHMQTHPITKEKANYITAGVGLASLLTTGGFYWITDKEPFVLFSGLLASASVTAITYFALQYNTPEARLGRAIAKYNNLKDFTLATTSFDNHTALLDAVDKIYVVHKYPLISAFNAATNKVEKALDAIDLFDLVIEETDDIALHEKIKNYKKEINAMTKNLSRALEVIKKSEQYLKQQQLYTEEQLAKEKLKIQQQMANAQEDLAHAQQQIANQGHNRK